MHLRTVFYKHPYATMVTAVFLYSLLMTAAYLLGLIPGEPRNQPIRTYLLVVTGTLLIATIASWVAVIVLADL